MDNQYNIKVRDITKIYKMYNTPLDRLKEAFSIKGKERHTNFYALSNISFDVKKGEILGIIGRNGAGKSTLLKIITGVLTPTVGEVEISGRISSLLELGTGFNIEYTGMENIYFYGTLMGLTKSEIDKKVKEIIDFAEIGDYIFQPVKTYSSGMFARLAFSCAINVDPDILIVDEILSVGDMRFQAKCFNKFKEFTEKGVTILYVGHDVGMMRTFCDRVIWLNGGKVVDYGDPTFICAQYTEFMYLEDITEFSAYKKYEYKKKEVDELETKEVKPEQAIKINDIQIKDSGFSDTIAHWGSYTGCIKEIRLENQKKQEIGYFSPNELISVKVKFDIPKDINTEFLSVAISIKNKEGTDLIVKTTYDEGKFYKGRTGEQNIWFEFKTQLAMGEYYLVVALENRENATISYYEYIEGAKYFKVYTDKKIFGVFDVDTKISLM